MVVPYNITYPSFLRGHLRSLQVPAVNGANEDCSQCLSRERQQNTKRVRVLLSLAKTLPLVRGIVLNLDSLLLIKNKLWELFGRVTRKHFKLLILRLETLNIRILGQLQTCLTRTTTQKSSSRKYSSIK